MSPAQEVRHAADFHEPGQRTERNTALGLGELGSLLGLDRFDTCIESPPDFFKNLSHGFE